MVLQPLAGRADGGEMKSLALAGCILSHGEPWVMQCLRDGEPAWTRVVSGLPTGEVRDARFVEAVSPRSLGRYGWHVPFRVDWTYGREQAHLYLDAEGELLFYFLSW